MLQDSLESLEYETLKHFLEDSAECPSAKRWARRLSPLRESGEILRELETTNDCIRLLANGLSLKFNHLVDYRDLFESASVPEFALEPKQFLMILILAECVEATRGLQKQLTSVAPHVAGLASNLPDLTPLIGTLRGKISPSGQVEDGASARLKRLRSQLAVLRVRLLQKLERILRKEADSSALQDDLVTVRNERYVIPVKVEKRKEITGIVHASSSSGATLFVEPLETLELNNELFRLKEQAEEEVRIILRTLTTAVRERLADLQKAEDLLGYLDFTLAKARFSNEYRCVIPQINESDDLSIVAGRHPILEKRMRLQGQDVVPISVSLNNSSRVLVISGPNTGGKTVALKTIGLLTLMALSGLPVPAQSANVCVFSQVMTDIGDHQSITENLSTFSSHLINIREILNTVSPPALVLLDELGTGTDPSEGAALGIAIMDRLRQKGAIAVVTTHHSGAKIYASTTPNVANASVEFDESSLRPTYRLIHGVPGESSGLAIARKLGLDEELIGSARKRLSSQEQQVALFTRHLREQIDLTSKLEAKLREGLCNLDSKSREIEARSSQQEAQQKLEWEQFRQVMIERFETESRRLLSEIQDKYLSVRARRELEKKGAMVRENFGREFAPTRRSREGSNVSARSGPESGVPVPFAVGSRVKVTRFGREGTIIEAHGDNSWEVSVGSFKCRVVSSELEAPETPELPAEVRSSGAPRVTVQIHSPELTSNEINLVGCTVDEALSRVDKFMDTALMASISQVRLIHGTGMGVLRRAVAEWLSIQPFVENFHVAETSQGGSGVTVVRLKL